MLDEKFFYITGEDSTTQIEFDFLIKNELLRLNIQEYMEEKEVSLVSNTNTFH